MMKSREELQMLLEELLGSRNVYFQPPESKKLHYPCIVYERSYIKTTKADNINFFMDNQYTITVMDKDPESEVIPKLMSLQYCRFDRHFVSDNLTHDVFSLYF